MLEFFKNLEICSFMHLYKIYAHSFCIFDTPNKVILRFFITTYQSLHTCNICIYAFVSALVISTYLHIFYYSCIIYSAILHDADLYRNPILHVFFTPAQYAVRNIFAIFFPLEWDRLFVSIMAQFWRGFVWAGLFLHNLQI